MCVGVDINSIVWEDNNKERAYDECPVSEGLFAGILLAED